MAISDDLFIENVDIGTGRQGRVLLRCQFSFSPQLILRSIQLGSGGNELRSSQMVLRVHFSSPGPAIDDNIAARMSAQCGGGGHSSCRLYRRKQVYGPRGVAIAGRCLLLLASLKVQFLNLWLPPGLMATTDGQAWIHYIYIFQGRMPRREGRFQVAKF